MWYVYILECANGNYYTGITNDLQKRMDKHAKGTASKFTAGFGFKKLLYQEQCTTRSEASKREAHIKRLTRQEKHALFSPRI
jgi:putative endonuclease